MIVTRYLYDFASRNNNKKCFLAVRDVLTYNCSITVYIGWFSNFCDLVTLAQLFFLYKLYYCFNVISVKQVTLITISLPFVEHIVRLLCIYIRKQKIFYNNNTFI